MMDVTSSALPTLFPLYYGHFKAKYTLSLTESFLKARADLVKGR